MQDLRLIGVHEDGQHLLLTDAQGARFRVSLDDALRAAARRDRPRLGQLQIEIDGGLRPREVQALIRRGLSTEEVADRAGWTVEKVRRFEGPVLAEREHVARKARE
ncbi:MAG: septation protein SepH, partial [Ornithinibacter sp.]